MTNDELRDLAREEQIAQVLRRRPRDARVPAFSGIESRSRRGASQFQVAASVVAVVVLSVAAGTALAEWRGANPDASEPTSTQVAATSNPAHGSPSPITPATATAAATVLSDRFGFLWSSPQTGLRVRPETGQGGFEIPALPYGFSSCGCAVSPDGTRIVYWNNRTGASNVELRMVHVARPTEHTTIYTAPAERRVSGAAWSSDGTGIVFALEGVDPPGSPVGGPPHTSLLVIEASGGNARVLDDRGAIYVPLGWDRAAGVAAAGISGEGGDMRAYLSVRTTGDPSPRRTGITESVPVLSVDVSTDQRFALGLFSDQTGSTLRWWRVGDLGTIQSGPRLDHSVRPKWRPSTSEIGWVAGGVLQLLDVERGTTRTGGIFPTTDYGLSAFRRDGSAAVATSLSGPTTLVLLEIASGRSERLVPAGPTLAGAVRFR